MTDCDSMFSCQVCSRPCSKYLHYGARTCMGCRAFFRRARQDKRYEMFKCISGDGKCDVNHYQDIDDLDNETTKRQKNCAHCRHKKCLEVGMNPSWMLSDEDREERKRRRFEDNANQVDFMVNKVVSMASEVGGTKDVITRIPAPTLFNVEQMLNLQRIVGDLHGIYYESVSSQMILNPRTTAAMIDSSLFGTEPGPWFVKGMEEFKKKTYQAIMERFPDMLPLPLCDRYYLLEKNFAVVFVFCMSNLCHREGYRATFNGTVKKIKERQSEDPIFEHFLEKLEVMEITDVPLTLHYDQVFPSPWLPSKSQEERHKNLLDKIRLWSKGDALDKSSDDFMVVLLYIILLLDTSGCQHNLRDPEKAVGLHRSFVGLLCRYLRWKYGFAKAKAWMEEGSSMVGMAREAYMIMNSMEEANVKEVEELPVPTF